MKRGLRVENLTVEIAADAARPIARPVDGVSFTVAPRECVVLLGESGCGKSLTALALMRLLPEVARIGAGRVELDGEDLFALPEREMRARRGGRLAMIFQEPQTALNPVLTVGAQIDEALAAHQGLTGAAARAEAERLLAAVGLSPAQHAAYPFQLSGGQRQRALIAMMLSGEPALLIADEPTTALDVTVQAQILNLLADLQRQRDMGLLLITHDLDVARDMADRVAVMYAGQIVEWASRERLFSAPRHPYTQRLFAVLPSAARRGAALAQIPGGVPAPDAWPAGCRFAERCPHAAEVCRTNPPPLVEVAPGHEVRCARLDAFTTAPTPVEAVPSAKTAAEAAPVLELVDLAVHYPIRRGLLQRTVGHVAAVEGVSLTLRAGETLALVGESGCGKTTLARAALRLIEPSAGDVRIQGESILGLKGEHLRRKRAAMQIVFQDPFASLNPRMRVGEILEEGILALRPELDRPSRAVLLARLIDQVGLPAEALKRYPHEFSGGQRQRIAIARALAVEPALLICDEPTSALDVSVQAQILNLLADLQRERGIAYLFISHNLAVVAYLADRIAVMYRGRIVEEGGAAALLATPAHPYTRLLLDSAPGHGLKAGGEAAGNDAVAAGCAFRPRCAEADAACATINPTLATLADGRRVACIRRMP